MTKTMIGKRFWTQAPRFQVLSLNNVVLVEYPQLEVLGVIVDAKLMFEAISVYLGRLHIRETVS